MSLLARFFDSIQAHDDSKFYLPYLPDDESWCLDTGCGPGRSMEALLDRGAKVIGVEKELDMLLWAKHRLQKFNSIQVDGRLLKVIFPLILSIKSLD